MSKAIENLNKAFKLFVEYPEWVTIGSVKEETLIIQAEEKLELKFPPTYRGFLKKYGCVEFCGNEYYGIWKKDLLGTSGSALMKITLGDRKEWGLPHKYIIVGAPGYGPYDAIDTSKPDANGECPVVEIDGPYKDPKTGEKNQWHEGEQLAPDFGTYLYNQSKEALENAIENGEVEEV